MRIITGLAVLILSVTGYPSRRALAAEPIAIHISGPADAVKLDSDLSIHIMLANTSNKDIAIPRILNDSDAEFNYSIEVRDEKGIVAPDTKYGASLRKNGVIGSRTIITLHPDESAPSETAVINKLFVLASGHTYTVQVKREYPSGSGAWIKSNSIKLFVSK